MKRSEPNRKVSLGIARTIPVLLLGITGYASWVVTGNLCVDYLIHPAPALSSPPRVGPATAIIVIYYILFIVTFTCYGRLLEVVTRRPGEVPRGRQWYVEESQKSRQTQSGRRRRRHSSRSEKERPSDTESAPKSEDVQHITIAPPTDGGFRVEDFWRRDVFVCNYDGRPPFCSTCYNWKPDRAHHCSELERCVMKMDHFCPWVGGVVGENSFKFFVQFNFWAALFCFHILVSVSYYFAERKRQEGYVDVHQAVIIGLSGLFLLFSFGMWMSSFQFACINSTTIENISRKRKVWYLAVFLPNETLAQIEERGRSHLRLITYPRPQAEELQTLEQHGANVSQSGTEDQSLRVDAVPPSQELRTFAILESCPGDNPWDIGYLENFMEIMGYTIWEWFLPLRPSPCTNHDSAESMYKLGPVVSRMKKDARIFETSDREQSRRKRRRSHGHRHSSSRSRQRSDVG